MDCTPPGSSVCGDSPSKNTGVGCHALLQGIFSTLRWNLGLLHWQADSLQVELPGKPVSCITTLLTLLYAGGQPPLLSTAIIPLLGLLLLYTSDFCDSSQKLSQIFQFYKLSTSLLHNSVIQNLFNEGKWGHKKDFLFSHLQI